MVSRSVLGAVRLCFVDAASSGTRAMIKSTPEQDAELIKRAYAGDAEAVRALVDGYLDRIVGFSYRILGDAAAAEDVAQETFLRLWRQAGRWRADAPVSSWLHKVAHNLCIDRVRKVAPAPLDDVPEPADLADGPARAFHRTELAAAIDEAIAALPERQGAAIHLVHREEMSNIEAAEVLGVSVEAVESLLARGRRTLRDKLAPLRADLDGEI